MVADRWWSPLAALLVGRNGKRGALCSLMLAGDQAAAITLRNALP
jgi:hypothetical protein